MAFLDQISNIIIITTTTRTVPGFAQESLYGLSVDNNRRPGSLENNAGDKIPGNPRSSPVPGSKDQKKEGKIRR
jgi:hypothetical protein